MADELGAPVLAVRAGFTVAALAGGIGVVAYLLLWLLTPAAEPDPDAPPRSEWPPLAFGLLATGAIALVLGPVPALIGAAAAGGAALVWWAPDRAGAE
ncbi:MAG: PspC domain-containing protein, partial [Gemmobacter sp.]